MQILFELSRFRNAHPAFNGTFELLDTINDIRESILYVPAETIPATASMDGSSAAFPASLDSQARRLFVACLRHLVSLCMLA